MRQSGFRRTWLLLVLVLSLAGSALPGAVAQASVNGEATGRGDVSSIVGSSSGLVSKPKHRGKDDKGPGKEKNDDKGQGKDKKDDKGDGPGKDKENGKDNGKHKGQNKGKGNNGNGNGNGKQQPIDATNAYTVDVTCLFDETANQSTCTFTGIAPDDGKKINEFSVPEAAICAEVMGGTADYVQADPKMNLTRYQSHGPDASFSLVLAGEVSTTGTTTYWFKVGGSIFPGQGAGLACADEAAESPPADNPDPGTPAAETSSTGKLVVTTYQCPQVPEDPQEFDWFGTCEQGGDYHFALDQAGAGAAKHYTLDIPDDGMTVFSDLEPGLYHLELSDAKWCHAESDRVNSEGNLSITAGENTQVWIFVCNVPAS